MLADVLDDGSCVKTGGFKSLGLTGSVGSITSCKATYPGVRTSGQVQSCSVERLNDDGYLYASFAFPVALYNVGETVKVELQYSLSNFACLGDSGHWGFREYTSNQWLDTSMVRSTSYYICAEWLNSYADITPSGGGGLTQLTQGEGECWHLPKYDHLDGCVVLMHACMLA